MKKFSSHLLRIAQFLIQSFSLEDKKEQLKDTWEEISSDKLKEIRDCCSEGYKIGIGNYKLTPVIKGGKSVVKEKEELIEYLDSHLIKGIDPEDVEFSILENFDQLNKVTVQLALDNKYLSVRSDTPIGYFQIMYKDDLGYKTVDTTIPYNNIMIELKTEPNTITKVVEKVFGLDSKGSFKKPKELTPEDLTDDQLKYFHELKNNQRMREDLLTRIYHAKNNKKVVEDEIDHYSKEERYSFLESIKDPLLTLWDKGGIQKINNFINSLPLPQKVASLGNKEAKRANTKRSSRNNKKLLKKLLRRASGTAGGILNLNPLARIIEKNLGVRVKTNSDSPYSSPILSLAQVKSEERSRGSFINLKLLWKASWHGKQQNQDLNDHWLRRVNLSTYSIYSGGDQFLEVVVKIYPKESYSDSEVISNRNKADDAASNIEKEIKEYLENTVEKNVDSANQFGPMRSYYRLFFRVEIPDSEFPIDELD